MSNNFFKTMILANVIMLILTPLWCYFVGQWTMDYNWSNVVGLYVAVAPNLVILLITVLGPLYNKRNHAR